MSRVRDTCISLSFQTPGEEVFGSQKHTQNTFSAGIWKTRVYVYIWIMLIGGIPFNPGSEVRIFFEFYFRDLDFLSFMIHCEEVFGQDPI